MRCVEPAGHRAGLAEEWRRAARPARRADLERAVGWDAAHVIGGKIRRLLTMASAENMNLLAGREMVIDELQAEHADVLEEFGEICEEHIDYIWANARDEGDE